ncbi:helix-turn-helix domain-containing protein [Bacillus tuaregi]|uniref:helix-turn-helix domain-containing protein n=1 Tax=Bacillus tuaregi TaxID=1816695 RepID=UPI0008F8987D|nr:helix-turn-helix domain-containing protein [Bacillus tuaregi]
MIKEREEEILWDTVTILKEQNRLENASALFKTLIERTFLTLKLPTKFLEEAKIDLPSNEFVNLFRKLDKEIYQSLKSSNMTLAYESFVEYIVKLAEVVPEADSKKIIANILAEQTQHQVENNWMPKVELATPITAVPSDVYTSTEVAEIIGVTDQTIRRWCEKGKYPGAFQTEGRHWRIPKKYFKLTLEEARKRKDFEQELNEFNAQHGEVNEDEFL